MWHGVLLPVERLLFESDLVRVGAFRCAAGDPLFHDSGAIQNHVIVFPRTAVKIQHEGGRAFVATPNVVTLYNRGQLYRRDSVGGQPDRCEWFAIETGALLGALQEVDPSVNDRPDRPFTAAFAAATATAYLRQRRLVNSLMNDVGAVDRWQVEEEVMGIVSSLLDVPPHETKSARSTWEKVEAVKELIATRLDQTLTLQQLAAAVDTSVYHLCRIFRRLTGSSIHAWREQARLRTSLESVASSGDLLGVAVDLDYSSHSHFTSRFRRTFGVPPSVFRARS